jgi:hypothetical protein
MSLELTDRKKDSKTAKDIIRSSKDDKIIRYENIDQHGTRENVQISVEHRAYLLQRHGTLDLNPLPSSDPADPLNWPTWKVSSRG